MTRIPNEARIVIELQGLKTGALRAKHAELLGASTNSNNRPYLIRKLAAAIVAQQPTEPPPTRKSPKRLHRKAAPRGTRRGRDRRLPAVGTTLRREHGGKAHEVKVLDQGFEYAGKPYRSLSAIAREITGTVWNGFLFFAKALEEAA